MPRRHTDPSTPAWRCDLCATPLNTKSNDGSVYFSYPEWHRYKEAEAEWKAVHTNADGWIAATAQQLMDHPELRWHVVHDACDPAAQTRYDIYWIDVNRMDTWAKVADWSAHLHGKGWFADTDWGELLYRAGVGKVAA